jgi:MmyB-like transcription regulator ligand binding domain
MLKPRDKRECDSLAQLEARLWPGRLIGQPGKQLIWVGLQPERLTNPSRSGEPGSQLRRPALDVTQVIEAAIGRGALGLLLEGVAPELLKPPVNCMRLALHPTGLAPRIRNLAQWRGHLLARLHREVALHGDPFVEELLQEVSAFAGPPLDLHADGGAIMVKLELDSSLGVLSLFGTVATFGTAVDITVAELSVEAFFPADAATAEALRVASLSDASN